MNAQQHIIDDLSGQWRRSGLNAGDTVLLHASARRTMKNLTSTRETEFTIEDLLESFLGALDVPRGTLLLPLFNFDFSRGEPFDLRHTPSQMGALTEAARHHRDALRTGHPMYSFAVLGGQRSRFKGLQNFSGYGPDSPFAILRELDGKIAVLDLPDQESMTMYHHVEEMHQVPYRFHKTFNGPYTDGDGQTKLASFGLFVRNLEAGVETFVEPMEEALWAAGHYEGDRPGIGSGLRVIRARTFYDAVSKIILDGLADRMLYRIAS